MVAPVPCCQALLRPGRFDRTITIDKPDLRGRTQIFLVHLRDLRVKHDKQDLAQRLSALTPGFAGADIANLTNEAALIAARANKDFIELVDFEKGTARSLAPHTQPPSLSFPTRRRTCHMPSPHSRPLRAPRACAV